MTVSEDGMLRTVGTDPESMAIWFDILTFVKIINESLHFGPWEQSEKYVV